MRDRGASDSESEDMCIIKIRREVLTPQPNTDIIPQSEEMETEEQDEPVLREKK